MLVNELPKTIKDFLDAIKVIDYSTAFNALSKYADSNKNKAAEKNLIVIAGPNGSGKSTLIKQYIEYFNLFDYEYINSDIYARNLFFDIQDEKEKYLKAFEIEKYKKETALKENRSFIMETVNSSDKNFNLYSRCKEKGYNITVIFIATIVIWFLQSFDLHLNHIEDSSQSILALISGLLEPLFRPLGLGDWRVCTSLISGVMAKESVISTLQILFAGGVQTALSQQAAASLLVFSLLYTPCIAAIASVKRELGAKWAAGLVLWQCALAWIAAFLVRLVSVII